MAMIAPFGLLRIAALPIGPLLELAPPATTGCIDAAVAELDRLERLRVPLVAALHDAVPVLDPTARATALRIRRCVHNVRPTQVDDARLGPVLAALPASGRVLLQEWVGSASSFVSHLAAAEASFLDELDHLVRPALRALADDEALRRPMAMASSAALEAVERGEVRQPAGARATRLERSILLYAGRAAAKTSPFSLFVHQAVVDIRGAEQLPTLDTTQRVSHVVVDRGLVSGLHDAAMRSTAARPAWLCLNESATWTADGRLTVLVPEDRRFGTRLLRLTRPTTFRLHPAVARGLAALPPRFDRDHLERTLTEVGLSPEAVRGFASLLRARGVVLAVPVTSTHDPDTQETCLRALQVAGAQDSSAYAVLQELCEGSRAVPSATSRARAALLRRSAARVTAVLPPGDRSSGSPTLYWEDGYFEQPVPSIGDGVMRLIRELTKALRPYAVVTAPYAALRDLFVGEYGADGVCRDVPAFLSRATRGLSRQRWWTDDPQLTERPAPAASPVHVSAMVQVHAADQASLAAGRGSVLLNEAYPGCGWLTARHAAGPAPFHAHAREQLRTWLAAIHTPAEPLDLMISGTCNTLQAHPPLTSRWLRRPGEGSREPGGTDLADVWLRHDSAADLLRMVDRSGTPLAPVYLGATVPQPAWGSDFWLATLAWPHRISRPGHELLPPSGSDIDVHHQPRHGVGDVVLSRASWWVRSDWMSRVWFRREGSGRLLDTAVACRAHGIPRHVFVRSVRRPGHGGSGDRKPLWVDTRNPLCLDTLRPVLDRVPWLLVTEALPSAPVWPTLAGLPHVAELHMELVV
jgi:hypothetical protein